MDETESGTSASDLASGYYAHPDLGRWLLELAADYRVLVPAEKGGNRIFQEVGTTDALCFGLAQDRTVLPAKKAFLPPEEMLFEFSAGRILPAMPLDDTIVFGLHVCELSADRLLTANMTHDRPDFHYLVRRNGGIIAGVSCRRTPGCFCEKTGHDQIVPGDFDLFLDLDGCSGWDSAGTGEQCGGKAKTSVAQPRLIAGSAAGRNLAASAPFPLENATGAIRAPEASAGSKTWPLDELPARIRDSFGAAIWDDLAVRCLGCGNCTIVCPLCYCFYTRDETGLAPETGRRLRLWDSCQLLAFARVAGGHNFRESRSERIWYRFSHKFMRMQETLGHAGCSGCGACFHFCPADIDPQQVIADVLGVTDGA